MWNLKICCILLSILHFMHHIATVRSEQWRVNLLQNHNINWTFNNDSLLPADIVTQDLKFMFGESAPRLHVTGRPIRDNFSIVLFAIPFEESAKDECPDAECFIQRENVRQNFWVNNITDQFPVFDTTFPGIFTGCYYTVIINQKGENFLARGPERYETNYTFADDRLFAETVIKRRPGDSQNTKGLYTELRIPSKLIQVIARLYAWNGEIVKEMEDFSLDRIIEDRSSLKQYCKIKIESLDNEDQVVYNCDKSILPSTPKLQVVPADRTDDKWQASFMWDNLSDQEDTYCLQFEPDFSEWDEHHDRFTWLSAHENDILLQSGDIENPKGPKNQFQGYLIPTVTSIAIAAVIAVMVIIFTYKMLKHRGLQMRIRNIINFGESDPVRREELTPRYHETTKSDHVLLIYKKDYDERSPLTSEITRLKSYLKTNYSTCRVYDIYASSDWGSGWELGVNNCVEKLLKDGSKAIWIDTSEFRSFVKNKERQYTGDDMGESGIRWALSVSKDCFLHAKTQYRCHFVVQVNGLEVEDGSDDPLQIFTPHIRYCIPNQLPLLCDDLRGATEGLEKRMIEVVVM